MRLRQEKHKELLVTTGVPERAKTKGTLGEGCNVKVSVASDHAGFEQKQQIIIYLQSKGFEVCDRGPYTSDRVDYPDYAAVVGQDVASGKADFGVLVCGTGIGMAIAANKISGVRAANIITPEFAALCREHNDANIITLSGRFVSLENNEAILDAFFAASFTGGRHGQRVQKIKNLES